jgi:hypothetical protein
MKRRRHSGVRIDGDGNVIGALATGEGATATQSGSISVGAASAPGSPRESRPDTAEAEPGRPADGTPPEYRAVLVVDAEGFSGTTSSQQAQTSAEIVEVLEAAFARAGLADAWRDRRFRPRAHTGDGYIVGLRTETLPRLLHPLLRELQRELRERDRRRPRTQAELRLRASVHVGPLPELGVGQPMTETHRLVDSDVLRAALHGPYRDATFLAVMVSKRVFEDWVAAGHTDLDTSQFQKVLVKVQGFEQEAYLYVPMGS